MKVDDASGATEGNAEYLHPVEDKPRVVGYERQELCPHKCEDNRVGT